MTLAERLRQGPMEIREALTLAVSIADGVSEAHENGVIHRDLKPDNIIITPRGYPKIMDFGLAKLVERKPLSTDTTMITHAGAVMGTPAYMSPEQAAGQESSALTDIFSLGVVLYELLTQQQAFAGDSDVDVLYSIMHLEPQPISELNSDIPSDIQSIVNRCCATSTCRSGSTPGPACWATWGRTSASSTPPSANR